MIEQDDTTARLVRTAGPRLDPPAGAAARVREAVYGEWIATTRRRRHRVRALASAGALAAAAVALFAIRFVGSNGTPAPPAETVAVVARVEGDVRYAADDGTDLLPLGVTGVLRAGSRVDTGEAGRAALRLADGASLRLDKSSQATLLAPNAIELTTGALYIDSSRNHPQLDIKTPFGVVRNIGTQFEVRLIHATLRLRVRSGAIEVRHGLRATSATAGIELLVTGDRATQRRIAAYGPEWEWTSRLAPAFAIEGRSVDAFLAHLAREHGWTMRYANAELRREARSIILHGSVEGLEPIDALEVALRTSGLAYRFDEPVVFVFRAE